MSGRKIPPAPPGWNKTTSDLMAEARAGKAVGSPEIDWARDYEISLLPPDLRFPKDGDVYEALADMEVEYLTSWAAPFTGGGTGLLKMGERMKVTSNSSVSRPIGVYLDALEYSALEERMVPSSDRSHDKYCRFYFFVKTLDLNTKFRLVE